MRGLVRGDASYLVSVFIRRSGGCAEASQVGSGAKLAWQGAGARQEAVASTFGSVRTQSGTPEVSSWVPGFKD